jgi:perosamine synthetase
VRYWHEVAGHNFRLTNMQAALGCAQLEHIGRISIERKRMFDSYGRYLAQVPGVAMQRFADDVDAVPWVVAVELDPSAYPQGRDAVLAELGGKGIETRPGFYTPTRMKHLYASQAIPCSDVVSDRVIALPSFPSLRDEQIELICSQLEHSRR